MNEAVDPEGFRSLHPRVRAVWFVHVAVAAALTGLGVAALLLVAAVGGAGWSRWWWAAPVLVAAAVVVAGAATIPVRYRRWRFRFDDDALVLERGSWWWVASAVPYHRIQQIDLEHGPVMRRLGVVALRIRTASAGSLARLPAVSADEADQVRAALLRRAGRDDGA